MTTFVAADSLSQDRQNQLLPKVSVHQPSFQPHNFSQKSINAKSCQLQQREAKKKNSKTPGISTVENRRPAGRAAGVFHLCDSAGIDRNAKSLHRRCRHHQHQHHRAKKKLGKKKSRWLAAPARLLLLLGTLLGWTRRK